MQPSPNSSPASLQGSRSTARASLLLSGLAAVVAGFGLGTLGLALTHSAPEVTVLPPPEALAAAEPAPRAEPATEPSRPWPDAFGTPATAAAEEPAAEAPTPAEPSPSAPAYSLRGTITDETGGWVLAEGPEGVELVRVGRPLSGGELVVDISAEGVVLQRDDQLFAIDFDQALPADSRPGTAPAPDGTGTSDAPETQTLPSHTPPRAESPRENVPTGAMNHEGPSTWPDHDINDPSTWPDADLDGPEWQSWIEEMEAREEALDEGLMDEF